MNFQEEYKRVKQLNEQATASQQRAEGVVEELKRELKDVWGCSSVKAAEKKLAALRKDAEDLEAEAEAALADFDNNWEQWQQAKQTPEAS